MDKAGKRRWAIWLCLLAGTVAAMLYPTEPKQGEALSEAVVRTARAPQASAATVVAKADQAANSDTERDALPKLEHDPFAPRGWTAPPPPPPPAPVAPPPPPPAAPAGPPALPFRFMGRLNDGGTEVVYLSHGEQTLVAKPGETLESTYKVLSVAAQRIDFEYLPTGDTQSLTIAAPDN